MARKTKMLSEEADPLLAFGPFVRHKQTLLVSTHLSGRVESSFPLNQAAVFVGHINLVDIIIAVNFKMRCLR